jgi:predicted RecB family endonuclease
LGPHFTIAEAARKLAHELGTTIDLAENEVPMGEFQETDLRSTSEGPLRRFMRRVLARR